MIEKRYPVCMEIAGPTAIWTRPDCGDSPTSYAAPTASAVRGMFEAVLWGHDISIVPTKVEICSPIQYHSYATNYGGPLRSQNQLKNDNNYQCFATVLVDVCYRLYADVVINQDKQNMSEASIKWDKNTTSPGHAYQAIFNRRLARGQSFGSLCLGWKEFTPSYFGPFREKTNVNTELPDIPISSMLDQSFSKGFHSAFHPSYHQNLVIHKGVLNYVKETEE